MYKNKSKQAVVTSEKKSNNDKVKAMPSSGKLHQAQKTLPKNSKVVQPATPKKLPPKQKSLPKTSKSELPAGNDSLDSYLNYIEENKEKINNIRTFLEQLIFEGEYHTQGNITHVSKDEVSGEMKNDFFSAVYQKNIWTFVNSKRGKHSLYYMSDVVAEQYGIISKLHGFFGDMPSIIRRHNISNDETLKILDETKDLSKSERLKIFLDKTVNGKSTQRIADVFGLEIYELQEVVDDDIFGVNLLVRKKVIL